jgi:NTP pyrophosphatase (non-canonical NTP hydrolase)
MSIFDDLIKSLNLLAGKNQGDEMITEPSECLTSIQRWQKEIHQNAVKHGWWESERQVPELLCLIHSEVSEALEAYRDGNDENFREELADVAIRLLDTAEGLGINLELEMFNKHRKNMSRPYRHGGKRC